MIGLVACAFALIGSQDSFPRVPGNPVLIQGVNVITCAKPMMLKSVDVFIADGRIKAIAKNFDASTYRLSTGTGAKIRTVDGEGKYLIPGLWDMHVHGTNVPGFPGLYLANGITGVRDMFDPTPATFKVRDQIERGDLQGPHVVAAGKIVDGNPPIWQGSAVATTADEGRKAVDQVLAEGSDFVKVYSLLPRDAYFAIAEESKKKHAVFAGHVPEVVSAEEASNAGQKSFEHLYGILKSCSSDTKLADTKLLGLPLEQYRPILKEMLDTYNERRAQKLFKTLKKNKTWQCPTFTVLYSVLHPKDPRVDMQNRFAYMPGWMKPFWTQYMDRYKNWMDEDYALRDRYFQKELSVVGEMYHAGVPILAGTDVMNPYCFPGFSLHDELGWLVKAGLTPNEALKVATVNATKYLRKEKDFGTIEKGKMADLVLLDKNPLDDIHNTTSINAVFVYGEYLDRQALDKLMPKSTDQSTQIPTIVAGLADDEP